MPKGIPKSKAMVEVFKEEIATQNKLIDEMLYRLCKLELREKDSRDSQDKRIEALERRISEMNEAFANARFPRAQIPTLTDAVQ